MEEIGRKCRACGGEAGDAVAIFEGRRTAEDRARIDEMLMACAAVQVAEGDGLPSFVCGGCSERLTSAYGFRRRCESTDRRLREALKPAASGERAVKKETAPPPALPDELEQLLGKEPDAEERLAAAANIKQEPGLAYASDCLKSDFIEFLENNQLLLTCRECSKAFTTLEGLRCHKRLHTGELFTCKVCGKEYTRHNHLQRHELSHGRRKVHVCKICGKTLTRYEHLKRHLAIHLKEKPFACPECGRGFNRAEHLANHAAKCRGEPAHVCDVCNKSFNRADSLQVHRKLHENKVPVLPTIESLDNISEHYYEIEDCDGSVAADDGDGDDSEDGSESPPSPAAPPEDENGAENSENEAPTDALESKPVPQEVEAPTGKVGDEELRRGDDVDSPPDLEGLLVRKVEEQDDYDYLNDNDYDNYDCNDVGDNNDSDTEYLPHAPAFKPKRGRGRPRKHPARTSTGRPRGRPRIKREASDVAEKPKKQLVYSCPVCNKAFSRANHLKRHAASHSEDKPFPCEKCSRCFTRADHLAQHMRLHVKPERSECEVCRRVFVRLDHLAKHMASKHGIGEKVVGEKRHKCPVCSKAFTTEKYRDVHMKGHTGEKKHQCRTCEKSFVSKSHLTEHVKFHNDNSKKFLCSECGQRFIRNDYLVIHMRRHRGEKPFKCKYCGKGFPRTTDLTVHERYHTGEKTHLCTICGRGFGRAYNLTVHMRTHTGEKPYQCSYCDSAFAQGNDLKAHVRRHTGERFQCDLCTETFLMGYLLTQHKRTVHGLNVVSNIRRLQPVNKTNSGEGEADEPAGQPITIPLPVPVIPTSNLCAQLLAAPEMPDVKTIIE